MASAYVITGASNYVLREFGVEGRFAQIDFDFELQRADAPVEQKRMQRVRALED